MMRASQNRRAVTLIELLIAITLLGLIAAVTALALNRLPKPNADDPYISITEARRTALARGKALVVKVRLDSVPFEVSVSPDGRVHADTSLHVDPLTGRKHAAAP